MSKHGDNNFEIYEIMTNTGINSVMVVRTVSRADGITYKCIAANEYGNDERLIKLMVVEVPSRPMNVRAKDSWSRSASLVWSSSFSGNSPITSYIIQYWRKSSSEDGQVSQNHRRQEFTVSGTQTSALVPNLIPSVTYEASVIAENQVGRSEPSENVVFNTSEDVPTAAPSDVSVEARGPSTIRVGWKVPPSETWNGKLQGFYVGYRPRSSSNSIDVLQIANVASGTFSYRTVDYVKGQQVFEVFLTGLLRGYEYEVVVKAFNNAGSSPESHQMTVRTFDGDLPASPSLFAHQATQSSLTLRWTYPSRAQSTANSIKRYVLYYQRPGDESWLELGIPVEDKLRAQEQDGQASFAISESGATSYVLNGLDAGSVYKIYVVAVNNFGMGDPSNIVTTKTEALKGESARFSFNQASDQNSSMFDISKQFQMFLMALVICTFILVVVIVSAVLYCGRRMQPAQAQHVISQPPNMQQGNPWGPDGTIQVGQRYVEFDKGGILKNGSLLTQNSDQASSGQQTNSGAPNGHFPLPYGTMPMNSVVITDQKSWDRQSSAPLKPLVAHIYDSPI